MRHFLFLLALLMVLFSCASQEICDGDNQSEMVARFKKETDGTAKDTTLTGISVYGVRPGLIDSLLYDSVTAAKIVLPLDPNHTYSTFVISVDTLQDTLTIHHQTEYYLISYTCGFAALFTLERTGISGSLINRSEIIDPVVDANLVQNEEHIWLYF